MGGEDEVEDEEDRVVLFLREHRVLLFLREHRVLLFLRDLVWERFDCRDHRVVYVRGCHGYYVGPTVPSVLDGLEVLRRVRRSRRGRDVNHLGAGVRVGSRLGAGGLPREADASWALLRDPERGWRCSPLGPTRRWVLLPLFP